MKHLIIDTEQEALLRQCLAMATGFLTARVERRDPAGFLSKALALQERKIANVQFQIDQPPIAGWLELDDAAKTEFLERLRALQTAEREHTRHVLYTQLLAFIMAHRAKPLERPQLSSRLTGEKS